MMRFFLFLFVTVSCVAQSEVRSLSNKLKEISGLVFVSDELMVGINDSGNSAKLYFISVQGEIVHEVSINGAENIDWEGLAFDGKDHIFVGDFGNNENQRQNLAIHVLSLKEALAEHEISSQKISFSYENQEKFPPNASDLHFDCEAMAYYNDSLYLFTKCRTEPFDGMSYVYSLNTNKDEQVANFLGELFVGNVGWWQDGITAADIQGDLCYLLTYNRLMKYKIVDQKLEFIQWTYLTPITQKESVAVNSKGQIFVADEQSAGMGGGFLYEVTFPKIKKAKKKK
jgi:hypothetical protein